MTFSLYSLNHGSWRTEKFPYSVQVKFLFVTGTRIKSCLFVWCFHCCKNPRLGIKSCFVLDLFFPFLHLVCRIIFYNNSKKNCTGRNLSRLTDPQCPSVEVGSVLGASPGSLQQLLWILLIIMCRSFHLRSVSEWTLEGSANKIRFKDLNTNHTSHHNNCFLRFVNNSCFIFSRLGGS